MPAARNVGLVTALFVSAVAVLSTLPPSDAAAQTAVFRVNAGGPGLASADGSSPAWSGDQAASPSPYVNAVATGNTTFSNSNPVVIRPEVPASVPMALFQSERWDPAAAPEMRWSFPVTNGPYEARLLFADIYSGTQGTGLRVFDVVIEGTTVLDDYDIYADVGGYTGTMKSFTTTVADGSLDIDFLHVVENPAIKGIEIRQLGSSGYLSPSPSQLGFGSVPVGGTSAPQTVTLTNLGQGGDPSITITSIAISGPFSHTLAPQTLGPGQSTTFQVQFSPTSSGTASGAVTITHSGANSPVTIALSGTGGIAIGFGSSVLAGASITNPTSLQFGPDNRLYVSQQDGTIKAFGVIRNGVNSYQVTSTETIDLIKNIPNHDDDGSLSSQTSRQVTGILVTGTPTQPVIYATSSDPRIGAGGGPSLNLDTNSGMISRLTWNGTSWVKLDLVRGLPRSEENHSSNGLQLDPATNTLYIVQGGHTNQGAPSTNFALLPEYALSGAMLSIDLDAIGDDTYDLPTLDDETRSNSGPGVDVGDPFGGNDGKNQAKLVPGGPVQVYSPGFRNAYDLLIDSSGRMYTVDNGPNAGWGGTPSNCTNAQVEPGVTLQDNLHFVTPGFYGGHPNPTRGNMANTFNPSNPQAPVTVSNPVECNYLQPFTQDGALILFSSSTNGLAEYTASNFASQMRGDLLAASLSGEIWRMKPTASGSALVDLNPPSGTYKQSLFSGFGSQPLDVVGLGDGGVFPGTVWVAVYGGAKIQVFEPNDYGGGGMPCTGAYDSGLDEDGDGFSNADEIDNGTSPCSAASVPPDWDGDHLSNLNDPDDDNDGLPDTSDRFAIDAANGTATSMPVIFTWNNDEPEAGGLLDLGFTGLMTNGASNYEALYDPYNMTAGGAAGVVTVDQVPDGDAVTGTNTQQYAFQLGVSVGGVTRKFVAHTRIMAPFAGFTPQNFQSMGLFIGTGDQDNYLKLVVSANGGNGGIEAALENAGVFSGTTFGPAQGVSILGASTVDLYLRVDPAALTVQPSFSVNGGLRANLGGPIAIPAAWHAGVIAVGLISTSNGPGAPFAASWDMLEIRPEDTIAAALVEVTPGGGLNASTYGAGSFRITNQSGAGVKITRARFDFPTAILRDLVFDPTGAAGDLTAKCFTSDLGAATVGLDPVGDPCSGPFRVPHDGGYDALEITFADFNPGEIFAFSVDVDPTSIQGVAAPGPNETGSVSGLELTGGSVTVGFDDGSILTAPLYREPGSSGGARAILKADPPDPPLLEILGLAGPQAVVSSPNQIARITGPADAPVSLLLVEGGLYTAGVPGGGHDLDPYEANTALIVSEASGRIGAAGTLDVPITLSHTGANGGFNHVVATLFDRDGSGRAGPLSTEWVLALGNVVGVAESAPPVFALHPAVPNPFGARTTLGFSVSRRERVTLRIVDVRGALVKILADGILEPAPYRVEWDGTDASGHPKAAGIYYAQLRGGGVVRSRRIALLR
jgi:hypothetical protein